MLTIPVVIGCCRILAKECDRLINEWMNSSKK